jgi:hypothetical protein
MYSILLNDMKNLVKYNIVSQILSEIIIRLKRTKFLTAAFDIYVDSRLCQYSCVLCRTLWEDTILISVDLFSMYGASK